MTFTLTFEDGEFILENNPHLTDTKTLNRVLLENPNWRKKRKNEFRTSNLKEAAVFREFADELAEKVFKRGFQSHYPLPDLPPLLQLDRHQREGLEWVLTRKRSYLAHAPGAGKTAQAILAGIYAKDPGQVLFIVPPGLAYNWEREIYKVSEWADVWPTIGRVTTSKDKASVAWRADFIICPDSMLTSAWVQEQLLSMPKKLIAVDEASRFKEISAGRSLSFYGGEKDAKRFPGLFQSARHVVFLDGSPMPNRPMELWAPAKALHPESIEDMSQTEFGFTYCGPRMGFKGWEFNGATREAELREKLQADFMHVVSENKLTHPERLRSILYMDQDVRSAEHKAWEKKNITQLSSALSENTSQGDLARFRRELGLRKVPWIAKYVRGRLDEKNESILLFAWHREVCEELARLLTKYDPGVIMGGTQARERERAFARFQAKETRLLILNISAGGRGHNLQSADRVIFGEFSWTDELNRQCEKRASRRGNENKSVRCEYIVSPGSIDEKVLTSVFTKQKRVERIIG